MKSLSEIIGTLRSHKIELFKKYPIKTLAIFGSYARQHHTEKSDVDLLVEFSDRIGLHFIDLAEELESIIGVNIDLVSKKAVKEKYINSIKDDLIYV